MKKLSCFLRPCLASLSAFSLISIPLCAGIHCSVMLCSLSVRNCRASFEKMRDSGCVGWGIGGIGSGRLAGGVGRIGGLDGRFFQGVNFVGYLENGGEDVRVCNFFGVVANRHSC